MHITKRLFLAAAMAAGLACSVQAVDLDLNGVDRTVTDVAELAGYDGVTNSSDTQATLTFNVATDMAYAGAISGNIRLVKMGNGMLDLSGASTYTGGTQIDDGRLVASSLTAFGATTGAIQVNSDCNGYTQGTGSTQSNNVTCVAFNCAGEFAYPINTSAWTTPSAAPNGWAGVVYYNVAVTVQGVTLSGKITGGGLSVHFGGLSWKDNADSPSGSGGLTISGDIDCGEGMCHFGSRATTINVTGKVTALGIYQNAAANWPPVWTLGNTGNSIGVIDVGGGASRDYSLTASAGDALGGATVYSRAGNLAKSYSVKIAADQTVESFSMKPDGSYAGGSLSESDSRHYIRATAAATVTMNATADRTNDWLLKDDGAAKAMSLVWNPTGDYTYTCVGHENTIHGTITVSGGTFEVGDSCSFPNVTAIYVANGATLKVSSAEVPFDSTVTIEAESGATLDLAGDMTAETVKVGDRYLSAKDFSAGTYHGLTVTGAGTLTVTTRPDTPDCTYTWIGGAADDNLTTDANWQYGEAPDFDGERPFVVFAGGSVAVLDRDASFSGVTFATAGDFTLSAASGRVLSLGEGGISNAPAASARAITVSVPVMPLANQVWQMETNTTFTLSGVLRKYGSSAPTLTVRQGSYADPPVGFVGAATAEGAGNFDGDIVFEETALPDGTFGAAHVRASGFEPFGPGGTLKVKGQGVGHNKKARVPRLRLANAIVSKAVEYGEYYLMEIHAEDNTTNVMNGAFTPFKAHATSGTFPPSFWIGSHAVLRLCGEMDFGTRNNSANADVSLDSTAENVADMPTGTIAFDGRITRLPRSLNMVSPIRLELNAANNAVTNLNLRHLKDGTAVVSFGADYALGSGQAMVAFPNYQSRMVDFDLNGTTQHIAGFAARTSGNAPTTSRISSSGAPGTLRVSPPVDTVFEARFGTNVTLKAEGPALLTFKHQRPFLPGSALELVGGKAVFDAPLVDLSRSSLILSGGSLALPTGTTLLDRLYCGGGPGGIRPAPRGFYSSVSVPGAEWEFLEPFLEGGVLFVIRSDLSSTGLHVFFMLED